MKPVTKIYLLMLSLMLAITTVFVTLYLKEKNQEQLLNENGVTATAWVTGISYNKASKKSAPTFYIEIAFFADSTIAIPEFNDTLSQIQNPVDAALNKMKIDTKPSGDYITSSIQIPQSLSGFYKVNEKVRIQYLKENPKIIRLIEKVK